MMDELLPMLVATANLSRNFFFGVNGKVEGCMAVQTKKGKRPMK